MAVRSGQEFTEGLRRAPREVWAAGRRIADVTTDPMFARAVRSIAELYDLQVSAAHREAMTVREDGVEYGASFLIPRSREDLARRRLSMQVWAEATFGMVGRSPDYLNTTLMTWAEGADFFAQRGPQFADNVRNYYKLCRGKDLFLTHAIVNPQTDRSKGSHQQSDEYAHLGVVEETKDGLIVRGAKMLATHGPTADEILVYPQPGNREGEEKYMLAFGISCAAKGLKFICREPFDDGRQSLWDHPLGARFEEPDAVCVFDDVLIPWDRVFLYGDVKMGNALFKQASIRNHTGHQTAVRGLAKCQLMTGIVIALTRTVKSDGFLHVQEQLGELLGYLQMIEARDRAVRAEGRADRPRRDPPGLRAAAGAALPPAEMVRAHGAGDADACRRRPADQPDRSGPALRDRPRHRALLQGRRRRGRGAHPALQACVGRDRHAVRPAHAALRALLRRRSGASCGFLLQRLRCRSVARHGEASACRALAHRCSRRLRDRTTPRSRISARNIDSQRPPSVDMVEQGKDSHGTWSDKKMTQPGGTIRKLFTRLLATGALLGLYVLGTVAATGVMMTAGTSPAMAQRGRGRGGGYYRGRGRGYYGGAAVGVGIAAGVVGGAIIADQARRSNAEEYCMSRFRSYNPNTGTYITSRGEERPCP